jgi:hypothetical protein
MIVKCQGTEGGKDQERQCYVTADNTLPKQITLSLSLKIFPSHGYRDVQAAEDFYEETLILLVQLQHRTTFPQNSPLSPQTDIPLLLPFFHFFSLPAQAYHCRCEMRV